MLQARFPTTAQQKEEEGKRNNDNHCMVAKGEVGTPKTAKII